MDDQTAKIRALNDQLRRRVGLPHFGSNKDRVMLTQGIIALPPEDHIDVLAKVRAFEDFSEDNDPHGEHDFGSVTCNGRTALWKVDYYDNDLHYHSPDKADPAQTVRVLTIMLAEEY